MTVGLILAGGRSQRFGEDKALYKLSKRSQPNVLQACNLLIGLTGKVLVAANSQNASQIRCLTAEHPQITVIADLAQWRGQGPLAALLTAAETSEAEDCLMIAVDYVNLISPILEKLLMYSSAYIRTPLHNHYCVAHLPLIQPILAGLLGSGEHRLQIYEQEVAAAPVAISNEQLMLNLNQRAAIHYENSN